MKNYIRVILLALVALSVWRCADDQPENAAPQKVQFTVHTVEPFKSNNGRTLDAYLPSGTKLLISVEKDNGEPALDQERVELFKVGDGYVSGPIALMPGTYSVTDFMLVLGDSVLYLTPKAGSPRAGEVSHPLPYSFTVSSDALLTLDAEVIHAEGSSPEEFGYTAFNIGINGTRGPIFQIAAFAAGDSGVTLTEADAYIMNGLDTLDHLALEPKTNTWSFDLDTTADYTLVVGRHGTMRYSRPFNYTKLKEELDGKPLNVTLTPAVTFTVTYQQGVGEGLLFYSQLFCGPDEEKYGHAYVDWGDNTGIQDYLIGGKFYPGSMEHTYAQNGTYFISIKGDLDMFLNFSIMTDVTEMDLSALSGMASFDLVHAHSLRYLRLSRTAKIQHLSLQNSAFTTGGISAVIDDLHAGAILNDTYGGSFDYSNVAPATRTANAQLLWLAAGMDWKINNGY